MELIRSRRAAALIAATAPALLGLSCTSTSTSATAPSGDKCQVSASATPMQFGAAGGSGSLNITAPRECSWTVVPQATWVSIPVQRSGSGDAVVPYSVATNSSTSSRSTDLIVGADRLQLTQAAAPPPPPPAPVPTPTPAPAPAPAPGPAPAPTPTPVPAAVTFTGTVAGLRGSCPTLTFSAGGHAVRTDKNTDYSKGRCNDLSDGDTVSVSGTTLLDGSVDADQIGITKNAK